MPRQRSAGVLIITLIVGTLAATVIGSILAGFIGRSSVVYQVLLRGYDYAFGPVVLNLVLFSFTLGFTITFNLLTILGMLAAYNYWKRRT